jgi:hypothetical protein
MYGRDALVTTQKCIDLDRGQQEHRPCTERSRHTGFDMPNVLHNFDLPWWHRHYPSGDMVHVEEREGAQRVGEHG